MTERIAVVVPVRGRDPKRRLSSILDARQRRQLLVSMLEDVLETLRRSKRVKDTFVVSPDAEILEFARRYSATPVQEETEGGVNSAVEAALAETKDYGATLIIPADIPFIKVRDVRNVAALYRFGASMVISPSERLDGTNLLLLKNGLDFTLHYDDDSFRSHTREALEKAIPTTVYYSESVAFDLDSSSDVHRAFRSEAGAAP